MFGFKEGSAQRIAALVEVSPVFKAVADFLAADALWDTAYEMLCEERTRITASARRAGVEVGSQYAPQTDGDRNAVRIHDVLSAHYCRPAMARLTLARRALLAAVWRTDAGEIPVSEWELSVHYIVSAVMPSRDDIIHISPVRVE